MTAGLKNGHLRATVRARLQPCRKKPRKTGALAPEGTISLSSQRVGGRRAAGFTLLELLVSMTLVSLLTVTILFAWRVASSAWLKADRRLREQRAVLAAHHVLEEQMASM